MLDLAVLAILQRGESYGYELTQSLLRAGFDDLGDATIYGTLRRMEQAAWVESHLVPSNDGPARKYYRLTADGKHAFTEAHDLWIDLHRSITTLIEEPS